MQSLVLYQAMNFWYLRRLFHPVLKPEARYIKADIPFLPRDHVKDRPCGVGEANGRYLQVMLCLLWFVTAAWCVAVDWSWGVVVLFLTSGSGTLMDDKLGKFVPC